jgi:hypothetical protein
MAAGDDTARFRVFCDKMLKFSVLIVGENLEHPFRKFWSLNDEHGAIYAIGVSLSSVMIVRVSRPMTERRDVSARKTRVFPGKTLPHLKHYGAAAQDLIGSQDTDSIGLFRLFAFERELG